MAQFLLLDSGKEVLFIFDGDDLARVGLELEDTEDGRPEEREDDERLGKADHVDGCDARFERQQSTPEEQVQTTKECAMARAARLDL